jgi:predicted TIM-barrel fold metal-dependent hydrolase
MISHSDALDGLDQLGLDEEATSRYLGGNAKRLLGIQTIGE